MAAAEAGGAGGRRPPKNAIKEMVPLRAAPTPLAAASRRGAGGDPPPPCVHGGGGPPAGRSQTAPDSAPWGGVAGAEADGGVPPRPPCRRGGRPLGTPLSTAARSAGSVAGRPPSDRGAPPWAAPSDRAWPGRRPPGGLAARPPRPEYRAGPPRARSAARQLQVAAVAAEYRRRAGRPSASKSPTSGRLSCPPPGCAAYRSGIIF